jgi:hypothetical protein
MTGARARAGAGGEGRGGGGQDHRLPQSDSAFRERAGPNIPLLLKGTSHGVAYIWCAILVGLGNESHVAGACPCCVVGGSELWKGARRRGPGQSQQADDAARTLCKRRHANSKLLTLQERSSPPLAPPRPRDAKPADGHGG